MWFMKLKFHERLAVLFFKGLGHLSLPAIYRLARFGSALLRPFPLQLKRTIARNVEHCFPHLSSKAQQALKTEAFLQTLWRILEMPFFWFNTQKIQALPLQISGEAVFRSEERRVG